MKTAQSVGLCLALLLFSQSAGAQTEEGGETRELTRAEIAEAEAIEEVCMGLFEAMRARDGQAALALMDSQTSIVRVNEDGTTRHSTGAEFAAGLAEMPFEPREIPIPMASIEVQVDGALAILRMPYEFYRGEEYSHCGVNNFHLARTGELWRVVSIVYTVHAACDIDGLGETQASP